MNSKFTEISNCIYFNCAQKFRVLTHIPIFNCPGKNVFQITLNLTYLVYVFKAKTMF